jgi:hypothetical protein
MRWLLLSLKYCLKNHQENALPSFKVCVLFITLNHLKMDSESFADSQLFRLLLIEVISVAQSGQQQNVGNGA